MSSSWVYDQPDRPANTGRGGGKPTSGHGPAASNKNNTPQFACLTAHIYIGPGGRVRMRLPLGLFWRLIGIAGLPSVCRRFSSPRRRQYTGNVPSIYTADVPAMFELNATSAWPSAAAHTRTNARNYNLIINFQDANASSKRLIPPLPPRHAAPSGRCKGAWTTQ